MIPLTDSNYVLYAAQHYDNPFPDTVEFNEDLKRIVYLKRLFNLYQDKGELRERLILNHLVILYNMFGIHLTPMLFLKLEGYESILKTFLSYLNKMPDKVIGVGIDCRTINNSAIPLDPDVWRKLVTI